MMQKHTFSENDDDLYSKDINKSNSKKNINIENSDTKHDEVSIESSGNFGQSPTRLNKMDIFIDKNEMSVREGEERVDISISSDDSQYHNTETVVWIDTHDNKNMNKEIIFVENDMGYEDNLPVIKNEEVTANVDCDAELEK